MKKLYILIAAVLLTATVWAQSPNKMSYQAVVRDANNELVSNSDIGMQISILQGSADGGSVYTETQTPQSNGNGLVSLEIGMGSTSDDFSAIDWSVGTYFIKTETDPTGGTSYTITGTSQLMSVPYALYAATSGSSTPGPQGEVGPQGPAGLDGADGADGSDGSAGATGPIGPTGLAGAAGPQGATGSAGNDGAVGNPGPSGNDGATGPQGPEGADGIDGLGVAQTIAKSGSLVSLSDGGGSFIDEVNDADFDPINELQTLSRNLDVVTLSNTGGFVSINDADSDPLNELQDISLSGNDLSISSGSTVDLTGIGFDGNFNNLTNVPTNLDIDETDDFDGQYNSLSGVPTNVSTFTNDASYLTSFTETDPIFGAAPAAGITNTLMTNWSIAYTWGNHSTSGYLTSEVDGSITNEIQTLSILGNDLTISGTGGNTVTLPAGASSWTANGGNVYRASGNVGIGFATPPTYKLQVYGTSKIQDRLTMGTNLANPLNQGGAILFNKATSGADDFRIETYTIDGLQISGTSLFFGSQTNGIHISDGDHQPVGNVGIGTTAPTEKLEVNGKIKSTNSRMMVAAQNQIATTETSPVDVPNISTTFTSGNLPVMIQVSISGTWSNTNGAVGYYRFLIDGIERDRVVAQYVSASDVKQVTMANISTLSAGLHTVTVQWWTDSGTLSCSWNSGLRSTLIWE